MFFSLSFIFPFHMCPVSFKHSLFHNIRRRQITIEETIFTYFRHFLNEIFSVKFQIVFKIPLKFNKPCVIFLLHLHGHLPEWRDIRDNCRESLLYNPYVAAMARRRAYSLSNFWRPFCPEIHCPDIHCPDIHYPDIHCPDIHCPDIHRPDVNSARPR